jgi:hypothetical protein
MRKSRAQLEKENDELNMRLAEVLAEQLRDRKHHREQLDTLAKNNFPFDWHKATADYGKPIHLAGSYTNDGGLTLELYTDDNGNIIGGFATERHVDGARFAFGYVPAVVY